MHPAGQLTVVVMDSALLVATEIDEVRPRLAPNSPASLPLDHINESDPPSAAGQSKTTYKSSPRLTPSVTVIVTVYDLASDMEHCFRIDS